MTRTWDDVNARARGWSTHLLGRAELAALARLPDLAALGADLERRGWIWSGGGGTRTAAALDHAVRRVAAARYRDLARWCGPRADALAAVYDALDQRSLQRLVRGAVEGTAPERRLAGLIPTPRLPIRALEELAAQARVAAIGALLVAWNHPLAGAVLTAGAGEHPDLVRFELQLARATLNRIAAQVRRLERRLQPDVRRLADLANITAALVQAAAPSDIEPADAFLPGGASVSAAAFTAAATAGSVLAAARRLGEALAPSPLAALVRRHGEDLAALDRAALGYRLRLAREAARQDPLAPWTTLAYALAVQAEVVSLQRIIWTLALAGPPAPVADELVLRA